MSHEIAKGLEIWTLQTLVNFSIFLGLFAMGLVLIQPYYFRLKNHLTLRVSIEWLETISVITADFFLALVVLIGFLVLNPDIMADIKIAVPFVPVATILFAIALIRRFFYGAHDIRTPAGKKVLWLLFWANLINIIGFSLIMEAPGERYLQLHSGAFWIFVKNYLRSNAAPYGLELAHWTFYICFPVMILILIWGFAKTMQFLNRENE